MKYRDAAAFRDALEQRLNNRSREVRTSLARLRKQVVFDRLLARLVQVAPGRWVLKGALALDFRLGRRARATKDMDLGRSDEEESATADLIAAASADLGDFFSFSVEGVRQITGEGEGARRPVPDPSGASGEAVRASRRRRGVLGPTPGGA